MPRLANGDKKPVAEVDDFLRFDLEIVYCFVRRLPDLDIALMAAMHAWQIGGDEATHAACVEVELDLRVEAEEQKVEISSIPGFISLAQEALEKGPAQSRA